MIPSEPELLEDAKRRGVARSHRRQQARPAGVGGCADHCSGRHGRVALPSLGSTETSVWRLRLEPETPALPHRVTREEIFVVLAGAATASLDGSPHAVSAGSTLVVPAGVELALATTEEALEAIVCLPVGGQGVVGDGEPFTPPWAA